MQNNIKAEKLSGFLKAFRIESPNDEVFSEIYYNNTMAVRTGMKNKSPVDDLFDECTTPLHKNAHLLMGHRGCGKSTELYRLKQRFEEAGQPVFTVDFISEANPYEATCWDLMLMLTEGLCQIAIDYKLNVPKELLKSVLSYLLTDEDKKTETDILIDAGIEGGIEANTPAILGGIIKTFVKIKSGMKASTNTRTTITEKMKKRASDWIEYINEITNQIVFKLSGKQPIMIFENIDKIQPPEKALDILRYPFLAEIPFPVIYTFPISLYYDERFSLIKNFYKPHMLPMIKVSNANHSENKEGINILMEIIKLRADMKLFDEFALKKLIKQTGGVLLDLFDCIISAARLAARRGSEKIEIEDADNALSDLREELSRQVEISDNEKLEKIYNDIKYREQIIDKEFILKKMQALVILEYRNGDRWHDLHPMIVNFLIGQGVIKN